VLDDTGSRTFLSLIIPAYNEQGRIAGTLETVSEFLASYGKPFEIIVVDDGSSDDTRDTAQGLADADPSIRVIAYGPNRGKGYAVRQGVLASRGSFVAFSDADLSTPIGELAKLFAATDKGYDIAIGSRAVKGSKLVARQPLYRELGGKALNLVIRAFAVPGTKDTQCGFKLFRGDVAREVFGKCFVDSWGFDVEVLYVARRLGYTITETAVVWQHAPGSTIRPFRAGLEVVKDIIRIRLHNYARR
jgi:dolichyl-phosphate beta-glucosyltransferase